MRTEEEWDADDRRVSLHPVHDRPLAQQRPFLLDPRTLQNTRSSTSDRVCTPHLIWNPAGNLRNFVLEWFISSKCKKWRAKQHLNTVQKSTVHLSKPETGRTWYSDPIHTDVQQKVQAAQHFRHLRGGHVFSFPPTKHSPVITGSQRRSLWPTASVPAVIWVHVSHA